MSKIKELTDRDWLLIRGHNIIGSLQPIKQQSFLYDVTESKFSWSEYQYIPGLLKIINEIIDNSLDVAIKSNFEYSNIISVNIDPIANKVQVEDNGYGIPVIKNDDGVYVPLIAWGRARAGSNFEDDDKRTSIGMNGIGSYSTTVFSTKFIGITDDGNKTATVTFEDNAAQNSIKISRSKSCGTKVTFWPDLKRFNVDKISELHISLIYQRLLNLSIMYPKIKFKFNRRLVRLDPKKFLSLFHTNYEFIETDEYIVAVFPNSDSDFNFHTYINGLWLEKGGNHISFISGKIVDEIRSRLIKRFKQIKPGDIKNKISIIVFYKEFSNPKFDGQTKEFLTNTQKEITDFMQFNEPDVKKLWSRFFNRIYKNKFLLEPIADLYRAKMLVEEKRALKNALKKQDMPDKYWPATKNNKYLFVAEGDSAIDAIISEISRDECGFFPLKGVPLNVVKDISGLLNNPELKQLSVILGIDLTTTNPILDYENIVIATDMDVDGSHIAGILLGFINMFAPDYLLEGKVFLLKTPLITIKNKKDEYEFIFDLESYEQFRDKNDKNGTKFVYDYKKGLGSLEEAEWYSLFNRYTLTDLLKPLHLLNSDNIDEELSELNNWLADDSDFRKERLSVKINDFDINKI